MIATVARSNLSLTGWKAFDIIKILIGKLLTDCCWLVFHTKTTTCTKAKTSVLKSRPSKLMKFGHGFAYLSHPLINWGRWNMTSLNPSSLEWSTWPWTVDVHFNYTCSHLHCQICSTPSPVRPPVHFHRIKSVLCPDEKTSWSPYVFVV